MKLPATQSQSQKNLVAKLNKSSGYLPIQMFNLLVSRGDIRAKSKITEEQKQPASLDLRLGKKAFRIQSSFLPGKEKVSKRLKDLKLYEVDLAKGGILERGAIYLIPLMEELRLPKDIYGLTNPKSSIGRIDMFTRVITDGSHRFDEIAPGYEGKLYLEVIARSFPVFVKAGLTLNQLRLIKQKQAKSNAEKLDIDNGKLQKLHKKDPILLDSQGVPLSEIIVDDGIYVGINLFCNGKEPIAFKAKANSAVIDLSQKAKYEPLEFWEPIYKRENKRLILEPESFYIMMSKEKICIRPNLLAEMVAYEPNSGELRTHYAGFFDPGFGFREDESLENQGTYAVMEVRPHDVPFLVEDGQTFCRLKFAEVIEEPKLPYGIGRNSNYHSQRLTLSKFFKEFKS